jgi:hypothetical protein
MRQDSNLWDGPKPITRNEFQAFHGLNETDSKIREIAFLTKEEDWHESTLDLSCVEFAEARCCYASRKWHLSLSAITQDVSIELAVLWAQTREPINKANFEWFKGRISDNQIILGIKQTHMFIGQVWAYLVVIEP